jgi:hypothetical protein
MMEPDMTNHPHDAEMFEPIRRAFRVSADRLSAAGRIEPIDAAIGATYAAHDLAMHAGMSPHDAIEWMRSATDLMERQLLAEARAH